MLSYRRSPAGNVSLSLCGLFLLPLTRTHLKTEAPCRHMIDRSDDDGDIPTDWCGGICDVTFDRISNKFLVFRLQHRRRRRHPMYGGEAPLRAFSPRKASYFIIWSSFCCRVASVVFGFVTLTFLCVCLFSCSICFRQQQVDQRLIYQRALLLTHVPVSTTSGSET